MGKRTEAKAGRERAEAGVDVLRGKTYFADSIELELAAGPGGAWVLYLKARAMGEEVQALYSGPLAELLKPGAKLVLESEEV